MLKKLPLMLLVLALVLTLTAVIIEDVEPAYGGVTFTVTKTADTNDGVCGFDCSLREAITAANASPGADTIAFNIPGPGPHTIQPLSALPTVTDAVTIDGYTEPGASPNTNGPGLGSNAVLKIELDGSAQPTGLGLLINANASTVRGLVVNRFDSDGVSLGFSDGYVVEGNFIGTDITGTVDLGNAGGGVTSAGDEGRVGGTGPAARNVISGNGFYGISIGSGQGNHVEGNFVGTDISGAQTLGNSGFGVGVGDPNNVIGGTAPGAGNVISGNSSSGISLLGAPGSKVQGNLIGTDVTGTVDLGNGGEGVGVTSAGPVFIGGPELGARNVISGNGSAGILGTDIEVQGNLIGTDITGTHALGNDLGGVLLGGGTSAIGGTGVGAGNVISGNGGAGIAMSGGGHQVLGNLIGTDVTGTVDLGNAEEGVFSHGPGNIIGGTVSGAGNVISGNDSFGVYISANDTLVEGNLIGTQADGMTPLGNALVGAVLYGQSNTIGGVDSAAANTIAHNGAAGVSVWGGTANAVRGNSIFANAGLGIDLQPLGGTPGVTPNDTGDGDSGPNGLQNFPIPASVTTSLSGVTVSGTLNSVPGTAFELDFYSNTVCDPSGLGEGEEFVGSWMVTTDGGGNGVFTATSLGVGPDSDGDGVPNAFAATATDPSGSTSEFSECVRVDNCPLVWNPSQEDFDFDVLGDACDPDDDNDGYWDADETAKGSLVLDAASTPEHCDGADNDGDTVLDEAPGMSGRATPDLLCDPGADPDGDTITNATDPDDDDDGFSDANERSMSTDELDDCRAVAGHDAWPPDFNMNTVANIIDVLFFATPILSGQHDSRFDLNGNGVVNIIDVLMFGPFMMQSCSNP